MSSSSAGDVRVRLPTSCASENVQSLNQDRSGVLEIYNHYISFTLVTIPRATSILLPGTNDTAGPSTLVRPQSIACLVSVSQD